MKHLPFSHSLSLSPLALGLRPLALGLRPLALGLSLLALGWSPLAARAEIILNSAVPDLPSSKQINVPKPEDRAAAPEKAAPLSDTMTFLNNDTLHGWLLGYEKTTDLQWLSPEAKEPITFQSGNVATIKLDSHKGNANAVPPTCLVTLTNEDELPGALVSVSDTELVIETWYTGKLTIKRAMVKRITPLKVSTNTLYEGPTSMDGWSSGQRGSGNKSWSYRDGALIGSNYGTLGRNVKLTPLSSVDFDLAWRGNQQMSVCLYSDKIDNISSCYMLQINSGNVYLQRYSQGSSNNLGEPVQVREMMRKEKLRIGVRVNKESKTIWLLINGNMIKQWTDTGEFAGGGTSMIFSAQSGGYVKISNIKVATWDGRIEQTGGVVNKSKEDNIRLSNQDKVSGKLKSIKNGKVLFGSSFAEMTIPVDRIEEISFSSEGAEQAKRAVGDIRAYFPDRGCITMELDSWTKTEAIGRSPNFGKATFSPDAFQRLQFNLSKTPGASTDSLEDEPAEQ